MKFDNVWISTHGHLEEFSRIVNSATRTRKFFGAYKVPEGYPCISGPFGLVKAPAIIIALGTLMIEETKITFKGKDFFGKKKFEFTISRSTDIKVSDYTFKSPINEIFDTDWINLESSELSQGLLLMKGFGGLNFNYQKTTGHIRKELNKWVFTTPS